MFCEIPFNLASVNSFFQQKVEMERCILFPVHSVIWWSSDWRILLFQGGKISQIKTGNSRDSWVLCHTVLCFPASSNFPKIPEMPFQADNRRGTPCCPGEHAQILFLAHCSSTCGIFPDASSLGNSWCQPDPSCTSRDCFLGLCGCHKTQK